MGKRATLLCISTLWMSSCALIPGSLGSEESTEVYELRSIDAACLLAEHLALQFTSIDPDPRHPKARALDRGDGYYKILYQRSKGRSFLPEANGQFMRDHFFCAAEKTFGEPTREVLRHVRFVPGYSTSVISGCLERVTVWIDPIGDSKCRVTFEFLGGTPRGREAHRFAMVRLLKFTEQLALAHRLLADNCRYEALAVLDRATKANLRGFSSAHNPLLAQAFVLMSRIHAADEDRVAAEQSMHYARLTTPSSMEITVQHTRLLEQQALPQAIPDNLRLAARMAEPAGQREQELVLSHILSQKNANRFSSLQQTLARARELKKERDWLGVKAWAQRALDLEPGNGEARSLMADSLQGTGHARDGRDTRLLALGSGTVSSTQILALAEAESALGDPELALRWILRFSKDFPELLTDPKTDELTKKLGWELTLRAMTSERLEPQALESIVAWMKQNPDNPRRRFVASALLEAVESRLGEHLSERGRVRLPDGIGAPSGVRTQAPVARPNR